MPEVDKAQRRRQSLAARREVAEADRRREAEQLLGHLEEAIGDARVVAAYVPVGTEPGTPEMLDLAADHGRTVLLPVTCIGPSGEHLALRWGRYRPGALTTGPFGLREPAGPALPAGALADAQVVLVPALAVDRRGVRLGRGGGFYDRSLALCAEGSRLIAVVRDDELVEELPAEPHDVPMTHALTPSGLIALGE